ncbi:MAG: hypothetical protein KatS3mg052_2281 [Candidatus Roseilinea sp.]|nr:MAG: hypothetical protein KatS3mg052_2281 [Candidatus Roseilinea sp.]
MPLSNQQVAAIFNDIADRLDIQGEIVFKVRAYRTAAENILNAPRSVAELWQAGALDQIPGVGKEIAAKIDELMRTGRLEFYERLRDEVPDGVARYVARAECGPEARQGILERNSASPAWTTWKLPRGPESCATCRAWARRPSRKSWPALSL